MYTVKSHSYRRFCGNDLLLCLFTLLVDAFQLCGLGKDSRRQGRVCLLGKDRVAGQQASD